MGSLESVIRAARAAPSSFLFPLFGLLVLVLPLAKLLLAALKSMFPVELLQLVG